MFVWLRSVTMENVSRFKGQEYCLHPRLQSTKNLVKWFKIWKDKHSLTTNVLNGICGPSMRNYRLIFCHNLKQP
ncbi:C-X-C motif chemokine 14 [Labeo rohita]|uniref:C-X-C motif chemokine 14 n=1 Tax=Labeo rohita TaxID=84645 RepID=A0A498NTH5_LABRO|nr:C-X-C motif chemokine 14 [Labeo rohita]